jgi:hypothetical protein
MQRKKGLVLHSVILHVFRGSQKPTTKPEGPQRNTEEAEPGLGELCLGIVH